MMPNGTYWKKRFELLEQKQNQIGIQCFSDIEKQFGQAQGQLEGQLSVWYQRLADNNGISMQEAKKWLTAAELEEFKWDVSQYIQHGKENAVNGQWVKQLENASAKYHISRLEALKIQIQQSIETLFGNQLDSIDRAMKNVYRSGYYHTAFEIQKGFNIGWDFAKLDNRRIAKVINTPWAADGKNFSARVWDNRTKLINELNTELTRNIITGADPQKAIDAVARKMKTSKNNAGRLVMTEEAFFSSAAQKDCFAELDVEQFEVVATLDSHTSDICRDMDGKHFKMSEWEIGVTAPPFHVYCRSTTVPYFDDDLGSIGERAARGEDGKTYYVPADMTYREWHRSFVDGDKSGFEEYKDHGIKHFKRCDTVNYMDITNEWTKKGKAGTVEEKLSYIANGINYMVDGKHVILKPSDKERAVAEVLSRQYGKSVGLVPQIMHPQGIQTPDYLVDGKRFDLKCFKSSGKNVVYNLISKKKKQSPNFIFDITDCPLSLDEIERQVIGVYSSTHTKFVDEIVVIKDGKILKVYKRP